MNGLKQWSDFCLSLATADSKHCYGIRKIVPDVLFEVSLDESIELTNVGFKEAGSKLTMLKKYYMNVESIEKAKAALEVIRKKKDYGSVAFITIGQEKKFTHHQHCIQSIAIRHYPTGEIEYTVFYRAAEVIKIFTGDMVFLRDVIMPIFGKGKIKIFFSNATLNAMYCPIMFIYFPKEWTLALKDIYNHDKAFFKRFKKWCQMYFSEEPINYSSAEVIRAHIHKHIKADSRAKLLRLFDIIERTNKVLERLK